MGVCSYVHITARLFPCFNKISNRSIIPLPHLLNHVIQQRDTLSGEGNNLTLVQPHNISIRIEGTINVYACI